MSVLLAVLTLGAGYLAWGFWPAFILQTNVKSELQGALPRYYQGNLLGEPRTGQVVTALRKDLTEKLRRLGVSDPQLALHFSRTPKRLTIEARYADSVRLPGLKRGYTMAFHPAAETDADRVDW